MPSSDHVKADAGARRVEEPLHGQIRLYNEESAEEEEMNQIISVNFFAIFLINNKLHFSRQSVINNHV